MKIGDCDEINSPEAKWSDVSCAKFLQFKKFKAYIYVGCSIKTESTRVRPLFFKLGL